MPLVYKILQFVLHKVGKWQSAMLIFLSYPILFNENNPGNCFSKCPGNISFVGDVSTCGLWWFHPLEHAAHQHLACSWALKRVWHRRVVPALCETALSARRSHRSMAKLTSIICHSIWLWPRIWRWLRLRIALRLAYWIWLRRMAGISAVGLSLLPPYPTIHHHQLLG